MLIVEEICECIKNEFGFIVLVGVVFCKFVVKVVSDENKFDGICVIIFDKFDEFVCEMLLKKILGVGKVIM